MPSQGLRIAGLSSIRQLFSPLFSPRGNDADAGLVRKRPSNLLYDVDETPPLLVSLGVSFQHVFLLSVGWLYVVVIVNSIGGTEAQAQSIIRISMIAGGLATILQSTRGVLGSGYFCPLTTSLIFLPPSILAVQAGGYPVLFGTVVVAGILVSFMSQVLDRAKVLFPPEVTGLMVAMAGFQLIRLGCPRFVGYTGPGSVPELHAFLVGAVTLFVMVGATVWDKGKLHALPMLLGLSAGYILALASGVMPWSQLVHELNEPWINLPHRVVSGIGFRFSILAPILIASLTAGLKMVGDVTLCQKINDADWKRTDMKSAGGGLLASGLGTIFSGLAGGMAQTSISSSIGLSLATGTTSRSLAIPTGIMIFVLAFFPKLAAVLAAMPAPVVGAILIYSACFIVLGGMQLLTSRMLDSRRIFAVGIALLFGLSVDISPELYRNVPSAFRPVFGSSTALATILVVSLSLLFRLGIAKRIRFEVVPGNAMEKINSVMEEHGAAWGMRREVVVRAIQAVNEAVNSALAFNPGLERARVITEFDEFKLRADVEYGGVPIQLAETAPSPESLATDQGIALLSSFMIRQFADRVRIKALKSACVIELTFDH
ncbi:MAG TPA: solute carrier family 23 protein [Terriglobales bacterium]|nr:solute carrier family 23 protein [Candidatus Eisenbacteria bacterium]HUK47890.1 solute carrier family 23 protein [Terriglobales bacterium]HVN17878.1 solute carrier family 23 protein [Dongiaceae bacterium]